MGLNILAAVKKWEQLKGDEVGFENFYRAIVDARNFIVENASLYICFAGMKSEEVFRELKQGYTLKNIIIWAKNNAQFGMLGANYHQKHEPILFCCNGEKYNWHGPNNEVTVWEIARAAKNEYHPTQKPIELVSRAIKNSSQRGEIILDLFGGSGSTLIACENASRKCYMAEIDPKYIDVIVERWEKLTGQTAVLM